MNGRLWTNLICQRYNKIRQKNYLNILKYFKRALVDLLICASAFSLLLVLSEEILYAINIDDYQVI